MGRVITIQKRSDGFVQSVNIVVGTNASETFGMVRTVYSGIFRDIQQYSAMFRHIEGH